MANYKAIIDQVRPTIQIGSRLSTMKTGKAIPIKSNTLSFQLIKYAAVKVPKIRNASLPISIGNIGITLFKRTSTIRVGKVAFSLSSFSRVSPRKRPWDGINRKNSM